MISRRFLIPTILLVGVITVAIGAPVVETIEGIKVVEIPQMGSGNLTLNRRFIEGVPGLPQCNDQFPELYSSFCVTEQLIRAECASSDNPGFRITQDTPCPKDTVCMEFIAESVRTGAEPDQFAICVDESLVKSFKEGQKEGVFCKTYEINGNSNNKVTISLKIYDSSQNPAPSDHVKIISYSTGNQFGSRAMASNYSSIIDIDSKNSQKIKVCIETVAGVPLVAMFSYLDGTYGSGSKGTYGHFKGQ